jgi:hypothetical protein
LSKISLEGNVSGSGTFTIASPNTNSSYTLSLPENTGTIITTGSTFAGTGPAFSAYLSASQSITTNTITKLQANTEVFDTANCYDNATNYRFTPNVAGYYQINAQITAGGTSISRLIIYIYKNGAGYQIGGDQTTNVGRVTISTLMYLNGTTDYVEIYGLVVATSPLFAANGGGITGSDGWFNGALARAA